MATKLTCTDFADIMARGYLDCAEWLAMDADTFEPAGDNQTHGFTKRAERQALADCKDFLRYAVESGAITDDDAVDFLCTEQGGRDFWLSRNCHGAGFFDGDWPEHGDALQCAAETFGDATCVWNPRSHKLSFLD